MFETIATGKNENYGKKNEKIKLSDNHVLTAIKNEWIKPNTLKWIRGNWNIGEGIEEKRVPVMPEKKVYVLDELKIQTRALERISKEFTYIEKKHKDMIKLFTKVAKNVGDKDGR